MSPGNPIRVVLVEDQPIMQASICDLINGDPDLEVCAVVGSAEEALKLATISSADLVLVDVSLPKMNGIQLVRALRDAYPELRCLMLSSHTQAVYVDSALEAGACGYVDKGGLHELHTAIRSVLAGEIFLSTRLRAGRP